MPDPASEFDALAEEFYAVWFRYRPDLALIAGVPGYACLLPAQDDDELGALAGWLESLLLGLDEIDRRALDPDRRLDYALMAGSARLEYRELRAFDWRRRDPLRFLPLAEIHRLTLEPPEGLRDWLAQLLVRVPEHLRHAQGQLRAAAASLAPSLERVAAREAEDGRCYLRELIRGPWLRGCCHGLNELESLAELACDALADFRELLLSELLPEATGTLGCGEEHLMRRLAELHFLEVEAVAVGESLSGALARVEDEIRRGAAPLEPFADSGPWESTPQRVPVDGPDCQALCEALRREIQVSGLVSLPQKPLRFGVRAHCPGVDRSGVHYLAQGPGAGTLYLPPVVAGDASPDQEPLWDLCLLAGWGGSHLFSFADRRRAELMPRRLANGRSLTLGWHLYLDRLLSDQPGSDPGRRLLSLKRRQQQLHLARLDLDLHRDRIDADEALTRLAAQGLKGPAAEARLSQIARTPGDALAGALGWLLLEAARECREAEQGSGFSPRGFHDRLASQGTVPLPLVLHSAFGESLWRAARARVLAD
jgi:hypothetical protein